MTDDKPVTKLGSPDRMAEVFAAAPEKLPVSPLAKRAATIALVGMLVNIAANVIMRAADDAFVSARPDQQELIGLLEVALLAVSRLGIIVIIVFALTFAVGAVPETAAGSGYSGRGRVIATFILCGILVLGLVYTAVSFVNLFA